MTDIRGISNTVDDDAETQEYEQLLVPIDAATYKLGGIGRSTLYELIQKGELTKISIGRRGFITAASIADFIDRRAAGVELGRVPA